MFVGTGPPDTASLKNYMIDCTKKKVILFFSFEATSKLTSCWNDRILISNYSDNQLTFNYLFICLFIYFLANRQIFTDSSVIDVRVSVVSFCQSDYTRTLGNYNSTLTFYRHKTGDNNCMLNNFGNGSRYLKTEDFIWISTNKNTF